MVRWFDVNHPHVINLIGASHLHAPYTVIFENVASTNLRKYLPAEENSPQFWNKFYEVARGLKFLHERCIFLDGLRCDHIWVGLNGAAKINLFCSSGGKGEVAIKITNIADAVRWRAPECNGIVPQSSASNVYSLAMCIIQAMSGAAPWGNEVNTEFLQFVVEDYPHIPEQFNDSEELLLMKMMLGDSSKRPSINTVVEYLKEFATQNSSTAATTKPSPVGQETNSLDLTSHIFFELSSSIEDFLKKLEWKCSLCRVSAKSAVHIYQHLLDVYKLLREAHRSPQDIVVTNYCDVLLRLDGFLRLALSDKSVLQVTRNQKVTLRNNVFHRDIDEVLALLSIKKADPIHKWSPEQVASELDLTVENQANSGSPSELTNKKKLLSKQ